MTMTETGGSPIFMGGNDGCGFGGGNGFVWAFLIFALLGFGGFGNGLNRGNGERLATTGDIQRGFDTNEITRKLDGINYGMCDGFYAQNTNLLNGFNGVNSAIASEGRAIQTQMAECCCNTNRNIDSVRFDMANYAAQSNANTVAMTQKVLDALNQNKVEALQNRVNQLELQSAMCGVVRYPNSMAYNAGCSPFCNCGNVCGNAYYAYA